MKIWIMILHSICLVSIFTFISCISKAYLELTSDPKRLMNPNIYSSCHSYPLNSTRIVERVYIIGLDGIGNLPKTHQTPTIQNLMKTGVFSLNGSTVMPSKSGPAWGSMIHSIEPEKHQLYTYPRLLQPFPVDSQFPSIFREYREKYINDTIGLFSIWRPIIHGIVERDIGMTQVRKNDDFQLFQQFYNFIDKEDPKLSMIVFDGTDHFGHKYGYFSNEQKEHLTKLDDKLNELLNLLKSKNYLENSLILVVTDHGGGGKKLKDHGSDDPKDMTIFFTCNGPHVPNNLDVNTNYNVMDISVIVGHFLGLPRPKEWKGKIPFQLV
ncbi:nucleotide pyrophosphatase [Tritrichomonas foetus]|uniref:Nucleotide pyrophosphatase n=1 Tax=Tritrichomonas foetus TaxID=1144522 RepID=A0A1J4KHH3_9EUKA|nr:nucleotide pyrophosphatase [Tritrichomonas foetus]|eukprot:OHT10651.1 nucleotide pyrophosphatase [Tritrichomonas foetus]